MKTIITYLILILSIVMHSQQPLDTIYANDHMNVALFFPKPIRQGITGADNFAFTYNRDNEQYFGLLQATPGDASNLLTITKDGNVYAYILKYEKTLTKLNYFINEEECMGNEKPEEVGSLIAMDTLKNNKEKSIYKRFSEYLLKTKHYPVATKRENGMVLKLLKMVYDKNEVYFAMEVKNNSGIDFELDYLNIHVVTENNGRKTSYQRLKQNIIYKYKVPSIILNRGSFKFVFVVPKFVLGKDEKLNMEMGELHGNRKISLM
ncbi:DUF4138 domain-containing protein [Confluentibacter flavum]|uniref:Conjugal transfer protein n=1 Tax=Confluentibacter flavum TaxID=1909700 RepID=A0A2N3HGZ7_9FLAO|nr:DUF4138 domain-containing protein [Confluentibacter flavum]PKQ44236.1 conjugal transfer protein [Confluentibacter flavum]